MGEVWVAGPASAVTLPDGRSMPLDELAAEAGVALVGTAGTGLPAHRFPLLAKLIDAADWLSLQVHPDDQLARRLHGADAVGKDEAWVVLEAEPDTRLVTGPARRLEPAGVRALVASGTMDLDMCELYVPEPGQALYVAAGTIHAIGPGTFIYELEQPSDLTYRISDWGRPATLGRHLHLDEAQQAVVGSQRAGLVGTGWTLDGGALNTRHLRLEVVTARPDDVGGRGASRTPAGRSPEIVTAFGGTLTLSGEGWTESVAPLETAVVPAACASYRIACDADAVALVGSLPVSPTLPR